MSSATSARALPRCVSPIVWEVESTRVIALRQALRVGEAMHTAVLSLAGRRFGVDAIPSVLSGRDHDGRPLTGAAQHGHKHALVGSTDATTIRHVALWAPVGLSERERSVLSGIRLRHEGQSFVLAPAPIEEHPSFRIARSWRSLTPYVPYNHVKTRGRNSVEGQILRELVEFRSFPTPASIAIAPWSQEPFVLRRQRKREQRAPPRSAFTVSVEFAEAVAGPVVLGALAHFSLGLMVPDDAVSDRR